jgi:hypothetical protein
MQRVMAWLCEAAEAATARARADGLDPPLDRSGRELGEPTPDERLRLASARARGLMLREAIYCLRLVLRRPPEGAERLAAFLADPLDDLVIEVLGAFTDWRTEAALPALLGLWQALPKPARGEAGAAGASGGGRSARPGVAAALARCLEGIAGCPFGSREALEAWIRARSKQAGAGQRAA